MSDVPLLPDPSERLVAGYATIARLRMQGLPFLNPAVEVEAVDFAPWEGFWLGVMITPWFVNLTLTPRDLAAWPAVGQGDKTTYVFPAGRYEFIAGHDPLLGDYQSCALFSPPGDFGDHASARLVASLARAALFDPANGETPDVGVPFPRAAAEGPGPLARLEAELATPVSKRDFLRGRFLTGNASGG